MAGCKQCGTEFEPTRSNNIYCSPPCGTSAYNARRRGSSVGPGPERIPTTIIPVATELKDEELIHLLQDKGYRIERDLPESKEIVLPPKEYVKIGVVSDTHFGSRYQQITHLRRQYELFEEQGIDTVLHCGDLVHGTHKMHRGMEYELFIHGARTQTDYAVEHFPAFSGKTYFISGNHDLSFHKDAGVDVVADYCDRRSDAEYLGQEAATFRIGSTNIRMWHPRGGSGYALSYRLQKVVEQVAPENKPNILLTGHWHSACHVIAYRNVEAFRLPCFQAQTPFEQGLALFPTVGGLVLELWLSERGVEDLRTHWNIQRIPIEDDYA